MRNIKAMCTERFGSPHWKSTDANWQKCVQKHARISWGAGTRGRSGLRCRLRKLRRPPDKWFSRKFRIDYGGSKLFPIQLSSGQNLSLISMCCCCCRCCCFCSLSVLAVARRASVFHWNRKSWKCSRSYIQRSYFKLVGITSRLRLPPAPNKRKSFWSGHERNHDESTLSKVTRELLTEHLNYIYYILVAVLVRCEGWLGLLAKKLAYRSIHECTSEIIYPGNLIRRSFFFSICWPILRSQLEIDCGIKLDLAFHGILFSSFHYRSLSFSPAKQ